MNGLIAWWARNAVAANLLMVTAFVAGVIGFFQLDREVFPGAVFNGASVNIAWPGASPQEVEEQIVVRIEEAMQGVDGIERLTAVAREGSGSVFIEAKRSVDINAFLDEIKNRVDSVNNLPQSAFPPRVNRWRAQNWFMGLALHGDVDPRELRRQADRIREDIALLPGGELARLDAVLDEEVTIEVSEEALRRYNLTFQEVAQAVRASSLNASGGSIRTEVGDVQLQARALADSADQFMNIILRQTPEGATIRVGDVATVIDGFVDANLSSSFNGEPMVMIALINTERMRVDDTAKAVKAYIEEANKTLPEALTLTLWWDDSKIYSDRMELISTNALLGLALVMCILVLFLRPAVAGWVVVGIATAFAGGFALLPFFDVSLNMLSLFAVLLVIGVIVDDAIVVGENIHREVEMGHRSGVDAAIHGAQLVSKPVLFGVITTIMAFLPWALLSGPERQFTQQISFVVIAALVFSLIESFFILPAHLAHLKPQRPGAGFWGRFITFQRKVADGLIWFAQNIYKPAVEFAIRNRWSTAALFIALFIAAVGIKQNNYVAFKFMPEIENETVQVTLTLPEGTPFSRSEQLKDRLLSAQERVKAHYAAEFPTDDREVIESWSAIASDGSVRAWMNLAPPEIRPGGLSTKEVAEKLREELGPIPDAEDIEFDFTINDNAPGVQFAVNHRDLDVMRAAVDDLKQQLATYEAVSDIRDNTRASAEEARFRLKPGAEAMGLTLADVTRQVRQAYFGEEVQRLPREGEDVRVMVRYPVEARRSLDSLNNFRVRTPDGREIPLSEVAEISFEPGVSRILRRERQRSATVSAEVPSETRGDIVKDLEENFFPAWEERYPGVSRGQVGEAEGEREFIAEVTILVSVVFGAMYILLAIAFRSYAQPVMIMSAIPFAYAGAVFGHALWGMDMAMFSLFGIGAAAGVVINDNLVLIDYVNRLRREGYGAMAALVEAGVNRFRPILLTTVTTVVGILPLMFEVSTDAQFLKPMVLSLASAVAFALFLTLFLVPALYTIGVDMKRLVVGMWTGERQSKIGASYDGTIRTDEEMPESRPAPAE